ncbi:sporulation protein [Streptomyces tendae]|uniref:sporulation protein n=1 Tax=Streptomyces tendae TaxID=1932 RepID=UPI00343A246C
MRFFNLGREGRDSERVHVVLMKAFGQLGFGFESADIENGQVNGTSLSLRFWQEIELNPAPLSKRTGSTRPGSTFLVGPR